MNILWPDERTNISVEGIRKYLGQQSWRVADHENNELLLFFKGFDDLGNPIRLLVPKVKSTPGFELRLDELIRTLAIIESRKPEQVIVDLISSSTGSANYPSITDDVMVRIVVAQTTNHQAASVGSKNFYAEPIVSEKILPLHYLKQCGINTDAVSNRCERSYEAWSLNRLKAILTRFQNLCETKEQDGQDSISQNKVVASVLVFPEYGVLREHCAYIKSQLANFQSDLSIAIFAGTHTLPDATDSLALSFYERILGLDPQKLETCYQSGLPTLSVLPVFLREPNSLGEFKCRSEFVLKRVLSPFELTNDQPHKELDGFDPGNRLVRLVCDLSKSTDSSEPIDVRRGRNLQCLRILPLICSEALQTPLHGDSSEFEIAVIPAYNDGTDQFNNIVGQLRDNGTITVLCNDGQTGGSGFFIPKNLGRGESWWFDSPNEGKLPKGDCMLSADVALRNLAETVKVNYRAENCRLQQLSAIVPSNFREPSYLIAKCLKQLRAFADDSFQTRQAQSPDPHLNQRQSHQIDPICGNGIGFDYANDHESLEASSVGVLADARRDILMDCLDNPGVSELQRKKISRLLNLTVISRSVWEFYCNDIEFANESHGGEYSGTTLSYLELESRLKKDCLRFCRKIASPENLTDVQHSRIKAVVELLSKPTRRRQSVDAGGSLLISYFGEFVQRVQSNSEEQALADLTMLVESIVEDLQAASAYVLAYCPRVYFANRRPADPDFRLDDWTIRDPMPLKTLFSYHSPWANEYAEEDTMAGHCLKLEKCIVYPDFYIRAEGATRRPFVDSNPNSRSAIAAPIIVNENGSRCKLGAVVLESSEANCFTDLDIAEFQQRVLELAPAIAHQKRKFEFPLLSIQWYPPSIGSIQALFQMAVGHLEKRLSKQAGPGGTAVTLWELDLGETPVATAFAIGTKGYSREYTAGKQLPVFKRRFYEAQKEDSEGDVRDDRVWKHLVDGSQIEKAVSSGLIRDWKRNTKYPKGVIVECNQYASPESYIGTNFLRQHGESSTSSWKNSQRYVRWKKAERTQLAQICGISVDIRRFWEKQSVRQSGLSSRQISSTHAITISTFLHSHLNVQDILHEEQLRRLADLCGAFMAHAIDQFEEWARLTFAYSLSTISSKALSFNHIRGAIEQLVDSDGCSLLVKDRNVQGMKFVSTTGLTCLGINLGDPSADFGFEPKDSRGLYYKFDAEGHDTIRLVHQQGRNFISKNVRINAARSEPPVVRYLESYTLSEFEHRKTLFVRSGGVGPVKIQAIFRFARRREAPFFCLCDIFTSERLSNYMSSFLEDVLELHFPMGGLGSRDDITRNLASEKPVEYLESTHVSSKSPSPTADFEGDEYLSCRKKSLQKAYVRINSYQSKFSSFSKNDVNQTIRDLFFIFDKYRSTLSVLRVAKRARNGQLGLKVQSFHTHSDFELIEESAGAFIYKSEGGVGWHSLNKGVGVLTDRKVDQFTCLFPHVQHITSQALCIPFLLPIRRHRSFPAVLSCEWADEDITPTDLELQAIYAGAAKLAALSYGTFSMEKLPKMSVEQFFSKLIDRVSRLTKDNIAKRFWPCNTHIADISDEFAIKFSSSKQFKGNWKGAEKIVDSLSDRTGTLESMLPFSVDTRGLPIHKDRAGQGGYHGRHNVKTLDCIRYLADRNCNVYREVNMLEVPISFGGVEFGTLYFRINDSWSRGSTLDWHAELQGLTEFVRLFDDCWHDLVISFVYSEGSFRPHIDAIEQDDHTQYIATFGPTAS